MNGMRRKWHKGPEWARSIVYIIFGLIVAVRICTGLCDTAAMELADARDF
jgi:hypothetical protein